jgi:hypothetical protein
VITRLSIAATLALAATLAAISTTASGAPVPRRGSLFVSGPPGTIVAPIAATPGDSSIAPDTTLQIFQFAPAPEESLGAETQGDHGIWVHASDGVWLRAPFGDHLLTDPDQWRAAGDNVERSAMLVDYNRVDRFRLGIAHQLQQPATMMPRLGTLIEYAFGRQRVLYGVQLEQPLLPPGRLALGVSMARRTDHGDLNQVDDVENSLALLLGRQDYRDYFEREGFGAYLSWRVPDFSTVSVHVRNDRYDSLVTDPDTRSWLMRDRALRPNPGVRAGEAHTLTVRLERMAHSTSRTRAGLYHWIEYERAGGGFKGDFDYARALADLRSVVRLSPATTLALRVVGGHTPEGDLPRQKQFTLGGVDGLRAHSFARYRGDELLLGQAEYVMGLWRLRAHAFEGGLNAIVFVDGGRAWFGHDHEWDVGRQQLQADGGFGLGTSEDRLRVYFARNLHEPASDFVISVRLNRPF